MLISEIEPPFSPLVVHSILAVFLGSSALISGVLVLWSDAHSKRTNRRLGGLIAVGAVLFSGGMAGWNIGGDELRAVADARFDLLLAEHFDATSTSRYSALKTELAAGDTRMTVTSGGVDIPVIVRRTGGLLQFFSPTGFEYLPKTP